MATITATKSGNWSDITVWDLGRVPIAGDDVALAGYTIVWDTAQTEAGGGSSVPKKMLMLDQFNGGILL